MTAFVLPAVITGEISLLQLEVLQESRTSNVIQSQGSKARRVSVYMQFSQKRKELGNAKHFTLNF